MWYELPELFVHLLGLVEWGSQQLPLLSGSSICGETQAHCVPFPRGCASQHFPGMSGSSICGEIHPVKQIIDNC